MVRSHNDLVNWYTKFINEIFQWWNMFLFILFLMILNCHIYNHDRSDHECILFNFLKKKKMYPINKHIFNIMKKSIQLKRKCEEIWKIFWILLDWLCLQIISIQWMLVLFRFWFSLHIQKYITLSCISMHIYLEFIFYFDEETQHFIYYLDEGNVWIAQI